MVVAPPVAAVATIPIAAPLIAVPAVVEFAIVPVSVPVAWTIWPIGPMGVRTTRTVPIRSVRPVRSMRIRSVRTIPVGSIGPIWTLRPVRPVGARLVGPLRSIRSIGTLRPFGTVGSIRSLRARAIGAVPVGSGIRALRTRIVRSLLRSCRPLRDGLTFRTRRLLTRAVGVTVLALRLSALRAARPVLARLRPVLSQNGHGSRCRHEEAGGRREHEKRTFHGRGPRTSELDGL